MDDRRVRLPRRPLLLALTAALGASLLAGCRSATAEPAAYLSSSPQRLVFLQWTRDRNRVSGEVTYNAPVSDGDSIATSVSSFTGSFAGSDVTINLATALDASSTWSGTLRGTRLTLSYTGDGGPTTLEFVPATTGAYGAALAGLKQAVQTQAGSQTSAGDEASRKAAVDKAAEAVRADIAALGTDTAALPSLTPDPSTVLKGVAGFVSAAHKAQISASAAKHKTVACNQAAAASSASASASAAADAAAASLDPLRKAVVTAQAAQSALAAAHGELVVALAAIPDYRPKGLPSDDDVQKAIDDSTAKLGPATDVLVQVTDGAPAKAALAAGYAATAQSACSSASG